MADQKLTELTGLTDPGAGDLLYAVADPTGVAASRKVTIGDVLDSDSRVTAVPGLLTGVAGLESTVAGLGTAATRDVPAGGDAAADEVVLGNDSRLSGGSGSALPRGYIDGLGTANGAADPAHDVTVSPGVCRDGTDAADIVLSAPMTKRLDAEWAAGSGNGGLFSGTVAGDSWYHVFVIGDGAGGVDVGFDSDPAGANIPSGFTHARRIGSLRTDGSANVVPYLQFGDRFAWAAPVRDVVDTPANNVGTLRSLSVPTGVAVVAETVWTLYERSLPTGRNLQLLISSPLVPDIEPAPGVATLRVFNNGGAASEQTENVAVDVVTDGQARVRYRLRQSLDAIGADIDLFCFTRGWRDGRGKDV